MTKSYKSVVRGAIAALNNATATRYRPPPPTSTLKPNPKLSLIQRLYDKQKKNPRPLSAETLALPEESILLTQFQRWTGTPYPIESPLPRRRSSIVGLDQNAFAQLLVSPTRMNKLARTVSPRDLMIRLGLVQNIEGTPKPYLLTPLWETEKQVTGAKAYISMTKSGLAAVAKKSGMILSFISQDLNTRQVEWNKALNYTQMLRIEIERLVSDLAKSEAGMKTPAAVEKPHYLVSFKTSLSIEADVIFPDSLDSDKSMVSFNVGKIIGREFASECADILNSDTLLVRASSDSNKPGMRLIKLLWKYKLFNTSN